MGNPQPYPQGNISEGVNTLYMLFIPSDKTVLVVYICFYNNYLLSAAKWDTIM